MVVMQKTIIGLGLGAYEYLLLAEIYASKPKALGPSQPLLSKPVVILITYKLTKKLK